MTSSQTHQNDAYTALDEVDETASKEENDYDDLSKLAIQHPNIFNCSSIRLISCLLRW